MQSWILPAALLGATIINAVLAHFRKHTLTDPERAALLTQLAQDAAAVLSAAFPTKPWAELVTMIVQRLLATPGVPTQSKQALEGAASAALIRLGKSPNGK